VESLLAYYELGVTTFLIRGFNPLLDSIEYGHEIIPRVRAEIAHRESLDRQPLDRHSVKTAKAG
jgi:alkanesulfonate monooxygenase